MNPTEQQIIKRLEAIRWSDDTLYGTAVNQGLTTAIAIVRECFSQSSSVEPRHKCGGRTNGYGGFTCVECGKYQEAERQSSSAGDWNAAMELEVLAKLIEECSGTAVDLTRSSQIAHSHDMAFSDPETQERYWGYRDGWQAALNRLQAASIPVSEGK